MKHPAGNKRAAAAHHVHDAPLPVQAVDGFAGQAAVKSHKVRPVFRLLLDDLEQIVRLHIDHSAPRFDRFYRRLVDRHRADHDRRMADDRPPRFANAIPGREIHHRVRPAAHRFVEL